MRVGVFTRMPRQFYYGGAEVQAEKTIEWLRRIGVEADYVEYSASRQKFDLFHFFGVCAFDLMTVTDLHKIQLRGHPDSRT